MRRHLLIGAVALLVVLAGCTGDGGGGSDPTDTNAANPGAGNGGNGGGGSGGDGGTGGDGVFGGSGGPGSMDSCPAGQSMSYMNPQGASGQVSMEIEGIVSYEGREVCKAVWQIDDSDSPFSRMEMYFALDGSYQKLLYYDAEGTVVTEINMTGGMTGGAGSFGGTGGSTDGMGAMTDVPASMWCPEGQQMQRVDPSSGQRTTMSIEGIVEHDGRQTCKAVWEVSGPDAERKEMYYTEDNSYLHVIGYDAEGNVVSEMKLPGQSTPAS